MFISFLSFQVIHKVPSSLHYSYMKTSLLCSSITFRHVLPLVAAQQLLSYCCSADVGTPPTGQKSELLLSCPAFKSAGFTIIFHSRSKNKTISSAFLKVECYRCTHEYVQLYSIEPVQSLFALTLTVVEF